MKELSHKTRREFILNTATTLATSSLAAGMAVAETTGSKPSVGANDQIRYGVIGYGSRCKYVLSSMLTHEDAQCVALADVWKQHRDDGKAAIDKHYGNTECKTYTDFRKLLERQDIDAVLIATGDRWHATASMLAAEAGKDIYCEKPCGLTMGLCQQLDDTIQKTGRIFQAGTQRRSVPNFQTAVEFVHNGKLGKLHTLHASVYEPTLQNTWLSREEFDPDSLEWNMWLGPAMWRPYNHEYVEGKWRKVWDFDAGCSLLDWAAHTLDLCQWANGSDDTGPIEFEPLSDKIMCRYASGVEVSLDFLPEPFGKREPHFITRLGTCPVRFEGERGSVETGDEGEIVASTEALQAELPPSQKRIRGIDATLHTRNFLDCMRSRKEPNASNRIMRHSHVASHAAAIAWVLQRKLKFDPQSESFPEDAEANRFRERPIREWEV
ncbi:Gfo/Idh/MocA family protein [Bythopirellula goksoeyrii]|uniref:Inositol 2-dehydrogenase n=1 Tax=Bythopirellula goksoeyrii TaxID=1400387 RepID=A0A5B9QJN0_9BACT|nr:Gfo/Idh/MocA family oxidoreductase [Bythopirellula goksoeyrii]QEG37790.1 Inositol 2-dehydrogenase [Bythopirellula goksoeyrii]